MNDIKSGDVSFRRLKKDDVTTLPSLEMDYTKGEVFLIISEDIVVGAIRYTFAKGNYIKIENIKIFQEYRRSGLGTKAVLLLKNTFEGCAFYGEILYIRAFQFWRSFKPYFNSSEGLDYFDENWGCDFFLE
jgi:hypothetical protein